MAAAIVAGEDEVRTVTPEIASKQQSGIRISTNSNAPSPPELRSLCAHHFRPPRMREPFTPKHARNEREPSALFPLPAGTSMVLRYVKAE